jgi:hypothetical protein
LRLHIYTNTRKWSRHRRYFRWNSFLILWCSLFSTCIGWCNDCKKVHRTNNIKTHQSHWETPTLRMTATGTESSFHDLYFFTLHLTPRNNHVVTATVDLLLFGYSRHTTSCSLGHYIASNRRKLIFAWRCILFHNKGNVNWFL